MPLSYLFDSSLSSNTLEVFNMIVLRIILGITNVMVFGNGWLYPKISKMDISTVASTTFRVNLVSFSDGNVIFYKNRVLVYIN